MGILFPTSLIVYMHPEDYQARHQEFRHRALYIKAACLEYVNAQLESHPKWQGYSKHSNYWWIQFVEYTENCLLKNGDIELPHPEKGFVMVVSDIYPRDYSTSAASSEDSGHTPTGGGRIVTTYTRAKGTVSFEGLNINTDALRDVTALGNNAFRLEFLSSDIKKAKGTSGESHSAEQPQQPAGQNSAPTPSRNPFKRPEEPAKPTAVSAVFKIYESKFVINGQKTDHCTIPAGEIQITGPNSNDSKDNSTILRIDDDGIMNPHIVMRYETDNQRFIIMAVGDVKLNSQILEKNNKWYDLPNNSAILLNDDIQINFEMNHA